MTYFIRSDLAQKILSFGIFQEYSVGVNICVGVAFFSKYDVA